MEDKTDIEIALDHNDIQKIKEFIKTGGNIYKEFKREPYYYVRETLMIRACTEKKTDIVEILLDVYERDYKIAEKYVSNEKDKDFLLKYIFIAWNDEEIQKVLQLQLSKKSKNNSKKSLVFLADRLECVLVSIVEDKKLLIKLYENGFLTIISREKTGISPDHLFGIINRLDLLKRMVAIGLNLENTLQCSVCDDKSFIEKMINQCNSVEFINYCVSELNLEHEDLLQFASQNESIQVFEFLLEYVCNDVSCNKKDYIQKYCQNSEFITICRRNMNYELLAHLLTEYNVTMESKTSFFKDFLTYSISVDYIKKIIDIEKENFDDLMDSIGMDTNSTVLDEIWKALDKNTLKNINKNNVKIIIDYYRKSQCEEYFHMVDPLKIYDKEKGNTALFIALKHNCELLIRHLISKKANLFHRNKEGHTTLTIACNFSTPAIVNLLMKTAPILINEFTVNGYYPLTKLIYRDDSFVDVFKDMLNMGADFHILDSDKNTLLHHAVRSQKVEFVKICLDLGIDPSLKGYNDNTALHLSAKETSLEIFDLILDTGKVDIETKNYKGNTILHNVCRSYFSYFFFSLVEKSKPNVNALNNARQPPLYCCHDNKQFKKLLEMGAATTIVGENNIPFYTTAAMECKNDILEEVFSNPNIDLTITSYDGETVLHFISDIFLSIDKYFENQNFREMFRKCTNIVSNQCNESAFHRAAFSCNLPFIEYMFEYGEPQLELKNNLGQTAIFSNLKNHFHKELLEYLIEKGADVNTQNNEGNSLIFESIFPEGTEILLKAGASTKIVNKKGQSALHYAAQWNDLETCLLLLKYGANLNLKDENNKTPLDLCTYAYVKDFLKFISE